MKLSLPGILSSMVLAGLLTWLLAWHPLSWPGSPHPCHLMIQLATKGATQMSVRLDEGHGIDDGRASDLAVDLAAGSVTHTIRLPLPPQRMRALRMAFTSTPAIVVQGVRLVFEEESPVDFTSQLQPGAATVVARTDAGLVFQSAPGSGAVQSVPPLPTVTVDWRPDHPIQLPAGDEPSIAGVMADFGLLTILLVLLQAACERLWPTSFWKRLAGGYSRLCRAACQRPVLTLAGIGAFAAVVSCYPVVFCHKSFVSPTTFPYLLHSGIPTIPGAPKERTQNTRGSDIAATMVYSVPNSALAYDALFRDHELPLWNRYVSAGLPFFGQGQSGLGNPLHLLTMVANGASWAWDLKFILAKALFSFGLGLCLWRLTRRLGVSALLGASGAWIGFFAYRMNHPAFFSICFAPWVLLPWLGAVAARSRWGLLCAMLGLLAADACELTSGTAKEACMILLFMNVAGFLILAWTSDDGAVPIRRLIVMVGTSFCFLLISTPQWLLFLDALRHGVSWYDIPVAYQLPPGLLIGFFDDIFSQDYTPFEVHTHPSANFLVLIGVLWLAAGGVARERRGTVLALVCTAVPLALLVFGVIPPDWIKATPFLGNIYHIHNTFGVPLILILLLLAGLGLSECFEQVGSDRWKGTYARMILALAGLVALYMGSIQATPPPLLPSPNSDPPWHSSFFLGYSLVLIVAVLLLPWALRWTAGAGSPRLAGVAAAGVCLFCLHFRHGMYVRTRFDDYVMTPRTAANLAAPSPALERVRRSLTEPYRTAGLDLTFNPDYNALMRLESINNIDAFSNAYFSAFIRAAHLPNTTSARIVIPEPALGAFKPVLDFLNLRYYLRELNSGEGPLKGVTPVGVDDLEVYESREAWPRAFFTDQVRHYRDAADLVAVIHHGDGRPFAAVDGGQPVADEASFGQRTIVPASQYRQSTNVTEFSVEVPGPGVIVLGEAFEEGNFRVTMNSKPVPYFRVNHAFKGVRVEKAGLCRLRFEYWPRLLTPSLWGAAAGMVLTLLLGWWVFSRGARE